MVKGFWDALSSSGRYWLYWSPPPDDRLAQTMVLLKPRHTVEVDRNAGLVIAMAHCPWGLAVALVQDGARPVWPSRLTVIDGVRVVGAACPQPVPVAAPSAARHAGPHGGAAR
jgi:hypothetical protein